jgi:hypothetical protein
MRSLSSKSGSLGLATIGKPLRVAIRSLPLVALGLALGLSPIFGQDSPRSWLAASVGVGGSGAAGPRYEGAPVLGVGFGVGVRLMGPLGLEAAIEVVKKFGLPLFECELPPPGYQCPIHFDLAGLSTSLVLIARPAGRLSRFHPSLGAGVYRAADGNPHEPSALGLKVGLEYTVLRRPHLDLAVGMRGLVLPRVHGEMLWVLPIGFSGRIF